MMHRSAIASRPVSSMVRLVVSLGLLWPARPPLTRASVGAGATLVGSFSVDGGAHWQTSPPTYTCVEACNMLFPGHNAMRLQGSTDGGGTVTGTCRGKAYAVGCDATPRADTYEVGPTYTSTGRWSTYVGDFTCGYINYWCVPKLAPSYVVIHQL
jgi:hypothetical protein